MSVISQNNYVEDEQTRDEVNRVCDKFITELSGIRLKISAIKNITDFHGPSTDAELLIDKAILRLQRQKR